MKSILLIFTTSLYLVSCQPKEEKKACCSKDAKKADSTITTDTTIKTNAPMMEGK